MTAGHPVSVTAATPTPTNKPSISPEYARVISLSGNGMRKVCAPLCAYAPGIKGDAFVYVPVKLTEIFQLERRVESELLTAAELARKLQVNVRTVQEWYRAGRIPAIKLSPKVIRYCLLDVVRAVDDERTHEIPLGDARQEGDLHG